MNEQDISPKDRVVGTRFKEVSTGGISQEQGASRCMVDGKRHCI